jgi:outer membrane protein assembly factor BamE (lipoprotein component of BamABCDE complex)
MPESLEMPKSMRPGIFGIAVLAGAAAALGGCSSIRDHRGFISDPVLTGAIQPGLDNQTSVERTLGHPTFTSQFGTPVWYYVSSTTKQAPFGRPRIETHSVLAVHFDEAGNVSSTERSGMEQVARIDPDGDETPTLGRERGFLEDLFGNIGQVGVPGAGSGQ